MHIIQTIFPQKSNFSIVEFKQLSRCKIWISETEPNCANGKVQASEKERIEERERELETQIKRARERERAREKELEINSERDTHTDSEHVDSPAHVVYWPRMKSRPNLNDIPVNSTQIT